MDKRWRKYFCWRARAVLLRRVGWARKSLTVITPSYDFARRGECLLAAIASITAQRNHRLSLEHLIIFEGDAPTAIEIETPEWYRYRIVSTPDDERYDTTQRNTGITLARGGWLAFLSDDWRWREGALQAIEQALAADVGVMLFLTRRDDNTTVSMLMDDVPQFDDISAMGIIVNRDVAGLAGFVHRFHRDYHYAADLIAMGSHYGFRWKALPFLIAEPQAIDNRWSNE